MKAGIVASAYTVPAGGGGTVNFGWTTAEPSFNTSLSSFTCQSFPTGKGLTYVASAGDVVTSVTGYGSSTSSGKWQVAVYNTSGGGATTMVGSPTNITMGSTVGWHSASCSVALTAGVEYTLGWDYFIDNSINYYYNLTGSNTWAYNTGATSLQSTWAFTSLGQARVCVYATVTHA